LIRCRAHHFYVTDQTYEVEAETKSLHLVICLKAAVNYNKSTETESQNVSLCSGGMRQNDSL